MRASGEKWMRWKNSIRHTSRDQEFPLKYRNRVLITTDADADYEISDTLLQAYRNISTTQDGNLPPLGTT